MVGGETCVAVPQGQRRRGHHILEELRDTLDRLLRRGLRELQGRPQKRDWILYQVQEWRTLVVSEKTDMRGHINDRSRGSRTEQSG